MGMFDTFVGSIRCPKCMEYINIEEQTKDYDCLLQEFKIGDYIDKGNVNYFHKISAYCCDCKEKIPVWAAIRNGQLVTYLTDIKDIDIMSIKNIEDGYERKREYEKMCEEKIGFDTTLNCTDEPFRVGTEIKFLKQKWIIDKVCVEKVVSSKNKSIDSFNQLYCARFIYFVHNYDGNKRIIKVRNGCAEMCLEYKDNENYKIVVIEEDEKTKQDNFLIKKDITVKELAEMMTKLAKEFPDAKVCLPDTKKGKTRCLNNKIYWADEDIVAIDFNTYKN